MPHAIGVKNLNLARSITGGIHLVWAFILVILWGVAKKDDGERQDLLYPIYTSFASWTDSSAGGAMDESVPLTSNGHPVIITGKYTFAGPSSPDGESDGETITGSECEMPKALPFSEHQTLTPAFKDSGMTISLHWIVIFVFLASAFFQTVAITVTPTKYLMPPTVRFVEYSITAPAMTVAIALQIGIMSWRTLLQLAVLSWVGAMVSICCEKARGAMQHVENEIKKNKHDDKHNAHSNVDRLVTDELKKVVFISQTIGWAILAATFYVLLTTFHDSQKACGSPESAPNFVWAIVYGQLLFYIIFGFMQVLEIVHAISDEQADLGYIVLSFLSKSFLGWMIYGGNFVQI